MVRRWKLRKGIRRERKENRGGSGRAGSTGSWGVVRPTRGKTLPHYGLQSGGERESGTWSRVYREGISTCLWRAGRELAAAPPLRTMGGPNYAQFDYGVHADKTDVRAEAYHVGRADDLFVGGGRLEGRDKPGGAVGGANSTARAEARGRTEGEGEAACGEGTKQVPVQPDAPATTKEDRGRRLGAGLRQQPR